MPDDLIRRRLRITGRVQGVFFRATTRDAARRAGATGWVRNDPDGAVTAEVQGPPGAVDAVVDVVRRGPAQAQVDDVEVADADVVDGESGFDVR